MTIISPHTPTLKFRFNDLLQSNEVGGSYHMEQEGLRRSLAKIETYIPVQTMVTDRHLSIAKMLREGYPRINHLFDIWHLGKSMLPIRVLSYYNFEFY